MSALPSQPFFFGDQQSGARRCMRNASPKLPAAWPMRGEWRADRGIVTKWLFHPGCAAAAGSGRASEDGEQRYHGERRDEQELVVIEVGDDLRLLGDHTVERGAPGRRQ